MAMGIFDKRTDVWKEEGRLVGRFDPTMPGCYDNVHTFPIAVKPKRELFVRLKADGHISLAIADSSNSSVFQKEDVVEGSFGPIPTQDNKDMGVLLGVYPGDKVTVDLEIWMER